MDIAFDVVADGTAVTVTQRTPAASLAEFMPTVDAGWACVLAMLREYLENHNPADPRNAATHRETTPDRDASEAALASAEAIAAWAGEHPDRVLATTPFGAVVTFPGLPGLFTLMASGQVVVWYRSWEADDIAAAQEKTEILADRLAARVESR